MVIVNKPRIKGNKTAADFAGKMESNIDWLSYQKNIMNER